MNRIREIRKQRGITQIELAKSVGVSCAYMHDLELGARGAKAETWAKIADKLCVQVDDLKDERRAC